MASKEAKTTKQAGYTESSSTCSMSSSAASEVSPTESNISVTQMNAAIDKATVLRNLNKLRSLHGSPPLEWSETCARLATMRANHRTGATIDFGENLARSADERWHDPTTACVQSLRHWQREEPRYNYETPGSSSNTDRFTANVWKQTTLVGFGVGTSKNKGKRTYYVVAYFFPRGNQPGEFGRNVLPKGTIFDKDRNIVKTATYTRNLGGDHPICVRVDTVSAEIRELQSPDNRFRFGMQPDRKVVVTQGNKLIWESASKSTHEPPVHGPCSLVLQNNGDLVACDAASREFWSSGTADCGPRPYRLTMQDDGHCVLYDGNWRAHWATSLRAQ